jgi:hypothetical protein
MHGHLERRLPYLRRQGEKEAKQKGARRVTARLRSVPAATTKRKARRKRRRAGAASPRGPQLPLHPRTVFMQATLRLLPKFPLAVDHARPAVKTPPVRSRLRRQVLQLPFILPADEGEWRRRHQAVTGEDELPKGRTIPGAHLTSSERGLRAVLRRKSLPVIQRPTTRGECEPGKGIRPCPWVSCAHHLYLDVHPVTRAVKVNFPDLEVELSDGSSAIDLSLMRETCVLDVVEKHPGGIFLEEVGQFNNLTMERIRQIEAAGLERLKADPGIRQLMDEHGTGPDGPIDDGPEPIT